MALKASIRAKTIPLSLIRVSLKATPFLLTVLSVCMTAQFVVAETPAARIMVQVRKRRAQHWDQWQLNSNICPPSLCGAAREVSVASTESRPFATGGSVFYQGDIVLDRKLVHYIFPSQSRHRYKRATVRFRSRLWKNGEVPYVLGESLSDQARRVVVSAFKHISLNTCIRFRQKKLSDRDFIKFISEPGCWSAIGRTGGEQLLSLGLGCENIGTAVHEIVHSLGIWHEQARKDRDKYVRIIEENISDRFLKDFEKLNSQVSSSRGFPYDYKSIMHYSKYAFTRNGKPTIEVIGIGKTLGFLLKERSELSSIDTAQLRDLYRCNLLTDTMETECPEGWFKHETSCYQFLVRPKKQFAAASKQCKELSSHLVFIESRREDEFLSSYLLKQFPFVDIWRTGGRVINGTMKWYREDSVPTEMAYTNWEQTHPASFSTMALQRNRTTNQTQWVGVWAGSLTQLPNFTYPFICERRVKRKCLKLRHNDGRDYRGKLDHTMDGYTCQRWTEQYPQQHNLTDPAESDNVQQNGKENDDGLGDHNLCRNPSKQRRSRPWCFTYKQKHQWQLCDVTVCSSADLLGSH